MPGAVILRRFLKEAFIGVDGREVGLGKQIDLPAHKEVYRYVAVHQLDEGLVGGIAFRRFVQSQPPAGDGCFLVAGGGVGDSGAVQIADPVDGPYSVAEDCIEFNIVLITLFRLRLSRGKDFIVDRGGLTPAAMALESTGQPVEKTNFLPVAGGMIGGPAQRVGGLRPVAGCEPGIGDTLFDDAGDLWVVLQESFVGGDGFGVASHSGQRLRAQENSAAAEGVICRQGAGL